MASIRPHGNKATEMALARLFRANKIVGWRRQQEIKIRRKTFVPPLFKVRPDFVFKKMRLAVFVDGCFWHGCKKHCVRPNIKPFWKRKFARNKRRDRLVNQTLRRAGWMVLRIWEHELTRKNEPRLLRRIQRTLK